MQGNRVMRIIFYARRGRAQSQKPLMAYKMDSYYRWLGVKTCIRLEAIGDRSHKMVTGPES